MFLQYFVMGLWAVTLGAFLMGSPHEGGLNLSARHVGLIYGTMAIGATVSPLFVGLLADRLFATQRVLAALHLLGAGILLAACLTCVGYAADVREAFDRIARREFLNERSSLDVAIYSAQDLRDRLECPNVESYSRRLHERERPVQDIKTLFFRWLKKERIPQYSPGYTQDEWDRFFDAELNRTRLARVTQAMQPALANARAAPEVVTAAERAFPPLFALMLAYACCYLPTITLSNALAFRNLPDPARQYGPVRALGTVGWVVAGLFVGFAAPAVSPLPFLYAAIVSAALAVLCLVQPHTPPAGKPKTLGDALGLPALRLLADRSFLVYVLTALVAAGLMPFHNSFTNKFLVDLHVEHAAAVQTLAQPTEIAGAVAIPWLWARWGAKRMLLVGLVASAARFALYASQSVPGILAVGLPLHGVGFSLFFIAAALYVDTQAPPDLRASAQGLVTLVTFGAGGILGNWFAGRVVHLHTVGGAVSWTPVWLVPALGTLTAAIAFALLFQEKATTEAQRHREEKE
jgi:nucleoside transporter